MASKRWIRLLTLLCAFALIAAACSDDDGGTAAAPATTAAAPATTAAAPATTAAAPATTAAAPATTAAAPASTELRVAWPELPAQLDPQVYVGLPDQDLGFNTMATLVKYSAEGGSDSVPTLEDLEPELAESIVANEDRTVYTITLREGVVSAFGNELTTADVEWSFERFSDPYGLVGGFLYAVGSVDAAQPITIIDDRTFEFHLTEPSVIGPAVLTWYAAGIYDSTEAKAHATDEDPLASAWLAEHTAGFGPYNVTSIDPGTEVRLESNKNYWRGPPAFETVVIRAVPEASTRIQLLRAGEVDLINNVPPNQVESLQGADGVVVHVLPSVQRQSLLMNNADERFANPLVRRAVSIAINRQAIVDVAYAGLAQVADRAIDRNVYDSDATVETDPEQAIALLTEAGLEGGFEFTLSINEQASGPETEEVARLIQADLAAIGVTMNIDVVPSFADFSGGFYTGSFQAWIYPSAPVVNDVGYDLFLYNASGAMLNVHGFSNADYDQLAAEVLVTVPGPERDDLIAQAADILLDQAPMIWVAERPWLLASSSSVTGFVAYPYVGVHFADLQN